MVSKKDLFSAGFHLVQAEAGRDPHSRDITMGNEGLTPNPACTLGWQEKCWAPSLPP